MLLTCSLLRHEVYTVFGSSSCCDWGKKFLVVRQKLAEKFYQLHYILLKDKPVPKIKLAGAEFKVA